MKTISEGISFRGAGGKTFDNSIIVIIFSQGYFFGYGVRNVTIL